MVLTSKKKNLQPKLAYLRRISFCFACTVAQAFIGLFIDQNTIAELFQSGGGGEFHDRIREAKDIGSNLLGFSADIDDGRSL